VALAKGVVNYDKQAQEELNRFKLELTSEDERGDKPTASNMRQASLRKGLRTLKG